MSEKSFSPRPKLACPDLAERLADPEMDWPAIASHGTFSLHLLRRKDEDDDTWQNLGFGIWNAAAGRFVRGSWKEPLSLEDYEGAENLLVEISGLSKTGTDVESLLSQLQSLPEKDRATVMEKLKLR